ncbi:hypothetical protein SAMN05661096_03859 [Marivirga sericea]|uniref:Lipocalin-like domain-containing protein n=1 Tax=Marivirga sericea TaxID=1028 RepID=A0A1X7LDZ1_9BACT|nr:hypothetical protein [Marivirga sericea]SMG52086.1 hypothetical protein SAMN05661096_03859 [Marivirga sericea]
MKRYLYFIFIPFLICSCNKEEFEPPFNNQEFYQNHEAANWTRDTAKEHLQGKWELVYIYCCGFGESNNWSAIDDGYFELQFEGDSVKVFRNNALDQTQYWKFDESFETSFDLETEDPISNTFGTMYFSEDYMLFNGSPSDGSDNYFQKVE